MISKRSCDRSSGGRVHYTHTSRLPFKSGQEPFTYNSVHYIGCGSMGRLRNRQVMAIKVHEYDDGYSQLKLSIGTSREQRRATRRFASRTPYVRSGKHLFRYVGKDVVLW